jgi:hypothetical protein
VSLDKDLVGALRVVMALEKVIETNLIKRCRRGEGRNVATNRDAGALSAVNHDCGIPAHPGAVGTLNCLVAWESGLILWADGVYVVGGGNQWNV